ncbi:MAG: class I SAM-dependent methyltransferase [Bellilinea sp.]
MTLTQRYMEKEDPWSSHTIINNWLAGLPSGTRVLDVGTSHGIVGRRFHQSGFYIKGIEVIPEFAELARPFYNEHLCAAFDDVPDEFIAFQDVIVLGDVLEHNPNPARILNRLIRLQKPETHIIISVPNVANLWVRINLLFGKFDYSENGILDQSHLRFFTKHTFIQLLFNSGLKIVELKFTPIPLNRVRPFFSKNRVGRFGHMLLARLTRLLPNLLAYQFVARTKLGQEGLHP